MRSVISSVITTWKTALKWPHRSNWHEEVWLILSETFPPKSLRSKRTQTNCQRSFFRLECADFAIFSTSFIISSIRYVKICSQNIRCRRVLHFISISFDDVELAPIFQSVCLPRDSAVTTALWNNQLFESIYQSVVAFGIAWCRNLR